MSKSEAATIREVYEITQRIEGKVEDLSESTMKKFDGLDRKYVRIDAFDPYKRIIQAVLLLIISAVVGAVITGITLTK